MLPLELPPRPKTFNAASNAFELSLPTNLFITGLKAFTSENDEGEAHLGVEADDLVLHWNRQAVKF